MPVALGLLRRPGLLMSKRKKSYPAVAIKVLIHSVRSLRSPDGVPHRP